MFPHSSKQVPIELPLGDLSGFWNGKRKEVRSSSRLSSFAFIAFRRLLFFRLVLNRAFLLCTNINKCEICFSSSVSLGLTLLSSHEDDDPD